MMDFARKKKVSVKPHKRQLGKKTVKVKGYKKTIKTEPKRRVFSLRKGQISGNMLVKGGDQYEGNKDIMELIREEIKPSEWMRGRSLHPGRGVATENYGSYAEKVGYVNREGSLKYDTPNWTTEPTPSLVKRKIYFGKGDNPKYGGLKAWDYEKLDDGKLRNVEKYLEEYHDKDYVSAGKALKRMDWKARKEERMETKGIKKIWARAKRITMGARKKNNVPINISRLIGLEETVDYLDNALSHNKKTGATHDFYKLDSDTLGRLKKPIKREMFFANKPKDGDKPGHKTLANVQHDGDKMRIFSAMGESGNQEFRKVVMHELAHPKTDSFFSPLTLRGFAGYAEASPSLLSHEGIEYKNDEIGRMYVQGRDKSEYKPSSKDKELTKMFFDEVGKDLFSREGMGKPIIKTQPNLTRLDRWSKEELPIGYALWARKKKKSKSVKKKILHTKKKVKGK